MGNVFNISEPSKISVLLCNLVYSLELYQKPHIEIGTKLLVRICHHYSCNYNIFSAYYFTSFLFLAFHSPFISTLNIYYSFRNHSSKKQQSYVKKTSKKIFMYLYIFSFLNESQLLLYLKLEIIPKIII